MMTTMMMIGLKSTAILVVAAFVTLVSRRASASLRHLVWTAALGALLALPLLEATGLHVEIPVATRWVAPTSSGVVDPAPNAVDTRIRHQAAGVVHQARLDASAHGADVAAETTNEPSTEGDVRSFAVVADRPEATSDVGRSEDAPLTDMVAEASFVPTGSVGVRTDPAAEHEPGGVVSWGRVTTAVWALGVLFLLSVALFGQVAAHRITVRDVRPAPAPARRRLATLATESGATRSVRLVVSSELRVPATWGLGASTIVLPEHYTSWSSETLDRVLLHELAHVERGDCRSQLLGEIARAVYWPNPLAWLAVESQRAESERACDDRVITRGDAPSAYAQDLVGIARSMRSGGAVPSAAMAMAGGSPVACRVRAILDPRRARSRVRPAGFVAAGAIAVALSLLTAAIVPVATAQEAPDRTPVPPPPIFVPAVIVQEAAAPDALRPVALLIAPPAAPSIGSEPPDMVWPPAVDPPASRADVPAATDPVSAAGAFGLAGYGRVGAASIALPTLLRASQSQEACVFREGQRRSTSTSIDDDRTRIRWETDDCRVEIEFEGRVEFAEDDSGVTALSNGAWFEIEERVGRTSRRVRLESEGGGRIERRYWVDGDAQDWGVEADQWLGRMLPQLFRHTTINAPARVRRMLEAGGPSRVFDEVEMMQSDHVSRRYLELMMDEADLSEAEYARVIDFAADIDSDHSAGELLLSVVERAGLRPSFQAGMLRAASEIESDHQKTRVLEALLASELSTEQLDAVVRAAQSIESDHSLGQVLSAVAREGRLSDTGRAAFMETLGSIESDHQHALVLGAFLDEGPLTDGELTQVLAMTNGLESDHQRATVLQRVASEYPLTGGQVTAYLRAASDIESDHQIATTAQTIIDRAEFTTEQLALVLRIADDIESDHQRAMVLSAVIERRELTESEVERVLAIARGLDSDHQLAQTLTLLLEDERLSEEGILGVVEGAARIGSDHQQASVLVALAGRYDLEGAARTLYLDLADDMSRHQRDQVRGAIVRR